MNSLIAPRKLRGSRLFDHIQDVFFQQTSRRCRRRKNGGTMNGVKNAACSTERSSTESVSIKQQNSDFVSLN